MEKRELESLLGKLHEELTTQDMIDDTSKELLQQLVVDIKKHVDPADNSDQSNLGDALEKAVVSLEENHPKLAKTVSSIIDTLNAMGI